MGWKLVIDPLFGVRLADELPLHLLSLPEHFPLSTFRTFYDLVALILCHFRGPPDGPLLFLNFDANRLFIHALCQADGVDQARLATATCHDDASAASFRYTRRILHDLAEAQIQTFLAAPGRHVACF